MGHPDWCNRDILKHLSGYFLAMLRPKWKLGPTE